eukprot:snap_masked-scaffold_18-processed-gene-2.51-mRNA-1 protein AED:1.00 eAED:1.00 QI:0/0/0/0/1/1/2/0/97
MLIPADYKASENLLTDSKEKKHRELVFRRIQCQEDLVLFDHLKVGIQISQGELRHSELNEVNMILNERGFILYLRKITWRQFSVVLKLIIVLAPEQL